TAQRPPTPQGRPLPSRQPLSSVPDRLGELVEPHNEPEQQTAHQEPWRRAEPQIRQIAESAEQQDGPDQRVTGSSRSARSADISLKRAQGTLDEPAAI